MDTMDALLSSHNWLTDIVGRMTGTELDLSDLIYPIISLVLVMLFLKFGATVADKSISPFSMFTTGTGLMIFILCFCLPHSWQTNYEQIVRTLLHLLGWHQDLPGGRHVIMAIEGTFAPPDSEWWYHLIWPSWLKAPALAASHITDRGDYYGGVHSTAWFAGGVFSLVGWIFLVPWWWWFGVRPIFQQEINTLGLFGQNVWAALQFLGVQYFYGTLLVVLTIWLADYLVPNFPY